MSRKGETMKELLAKLGKRAYAIPFVIALLIFCLLGCAIAPMMHMAPRNVPVAVVNLDQGATLPTGETMVAGDLIVEHLDEAVASAANGSDEAPMAFTVLASRAELDAAMEAGEYYGAIVIPRDFTEKQMAGNTALAATLASGLQSVMADQQQAQAASGAAAALAAQSDPAAAAIAQQQAQAALAERVQGVVASAVTAQQTADKPSVELVVNTAKSPLFANTMQSSMTTALAAQGIEVEVTSIGKSAESANPISGIMGIQMMVMPLFIMSLVMSLLAMAFTWMPLGNATRAEKGKAAGIQMGYCAIASLAAATLAYGVVAWIGGIEVPTTAILFLWVASFCIMLANIGLCDLALPLGVVVMLCVFALGMGTAVLPPEMLPSFWANWVVPWAPQEAIGEGLRNIIYLDGGAFDVGMPKLLAWGCAGLIALVLAIVVPSRKQKASAEND